MRPDNFDYRRAPATTPFTLSWRGAAALVLLGTNAVLQFLPPIPPLWKGSIWSYLLAYAAVAAGVSEALRLAPHLLSRWRHSMPLKRALVYAGTLGAIALLGMALRAADPVAFARWSREEGIWEPLTVFAYLGAAAMLLATARRNSGERKHYRFLGSGFVLLAVEEMDYFGIFGGFIGRIDGVYVGSPHDLLRLWERGLLPAAWAAAAALLVLAAAVGLWRTGYLQPRALARLARTLAAPWLLLGASLIVLGTLDDASLLRILNAPTVEELIELMGAVSLLAFAIEAALRVPALRPEKVRGTTRRIPIASGQ